ncbi:MAG: NUDIX domain-containing protein [Minisyncoccia bacterium]
MALDDHHKHFVGTVAQKAFIEKDGKLLLVQYPTNDPFVAGTWDLPGGRLHQGESVIEGLTREVREEIGAEVEVEKILKTAVNVGPSFSAYVVIYKAALRDRDQELIPEAGEIGGIEWRDKSEIANLEFASAGVKAALMNILG